MKYSDWVANYQSWYNEGLKKEVKAFDDDQKSLEDRKVEAMLDYVRAQFAVHKHYENKPMVIQWVDEMNKFIAFNNSMVEREKRNAVEVAKALIKEAKPKKRRK